ncbi:MAG: DUF4861 domain-containing protein [Bacteroidales bacterium]|nr:DUF4861 domain-containing protein [Bacteroidales bacterium]MCL2132804.1 DUF4861 domain-containing protein [Bacteroidales bacterium]
MKPYLSIFLLALTVINCSSTPLKVTITNPLGIDRQQETVEIACGELLQYLPALEKGTDSYVVYNENDEEIPSQIVYEGKDSPQKLIFQVNVEANACVQYSIVYNKGKQNNYTAKVYGRFAPERYDDYFWENDRIAFRIYGLALIAKDGPSNGLDAIVKRTDQFFMDKIYKDYTENKISYHVDHGEGVDCYKVGRSLGCGAMAPYINGKLCLGQNFAGWQTLDNGPIRTSVRLDYNEFDAEGIAVGETRIFSLDVGAHLNKVTEIFTGFEGTVPVAAGIVFKKEGKPVDVDKADPNHIPILAPEKGYIIYSEEGDKAKPDHENGIVYTAVVFPEALKDAKLEQQHILAISDYLSESELTYYTGAGWSKWGFTSLDEWTTYINKFAQQLQDPLEIKLEKK